MREWRVVATFQVGEAVPKITPVQWDHGIPSAALPGKLCKPVAFNSSPWASTAAASPGNMLDMQILKPPLRRLN